MKGISRSMKIYNQEISLEFPKVLISNDIFPLVTKIVTNNSNVNVISPWTKVSELLNYNKGSALINILKQEFAEIENHIFNIDYVNDVVAQINEKLKGDYVEFDFKSNKLIKDHFPLSDNLIDEKNLLDILKIIDEYDTNKTTFIILGFRNIISTICQYEFSRLQLLFIQPYLDQVASYERLESILLDEGTSLFEVLDADKFLSYLETKTKSVLSREDINNYFQGKMDFKSFLIHRVLHNLKNE